MEESKPEQTERRKYNDEQLELFRTLVEEEKCTTEMINDLTGIPIGSLSYLCKGLGIHVEKGVTGGRGGIHNIIRARKVSILKNKYGEHLTRLFGKKE